MALELGAMWRLVGCWLASYPGEIVRTTTACERSESVKNGQNLHAKVEYLALHASVLGNTATRAVVVVLEVGCKCPKKMSSTKTWQRRQ